MSLRLRLNLLITALLLLFMLAVGAMILNGTKSSIQEGVESATRVTAQLLDTVILSSNQNLEWGYTHDVMRRFLQQLGHVRSNEIYLYDIRRNLIFKSPPSKYRSTENPPQWFYDMLDPKEASVSRLIRYGRLDGGWHGGWLTVWVPFHHSKGKPIPCRDKSLRRDDCEGSTPAPLG